MSKSGYIEHVGSKEDCQFVANAANFLSSDEDSSEQSTGHLVSRQTLLKDNADLKAKIGVLEKENFELRKALAIAKKNCNSCPFSLYRYYLN